MQQKKPLELIFKLCEVTKPNMLFKHRLAQAVYLELMQQKKPLELIIKLHEVGNQTMLYKHGLALAVYLELNQQQKPRELIFKPCKIYGKHIKQNSFTLLSFRAPERPRY
jgi:hypothetical protein